MKLTLVLVALSVAALAADFHARIQVFTNSEDSALKEQVNSLLQHALERIDGVITVGKEPDYIIVVLVAKPGSGGAEMIGISVIAEEVAEPRLSERWFLRSDYKGEMQSGKHIFESLRRIDHIGLEVGPPESIPTMCAALVKTIDASTLERERQHPRGGSTFDEVFDHFLLRMGWKPVIKGSPER